MNLAEAKHDVLRVFKPNRIIYNPEMLNQGEEIAIN